MHSKIMDLIFLVQYLKNSECSQAPACLSVWYKNSRVSLRKARKKVLRFSGVNELYDGFRFVRGDKMSMASRDDPAPHCWVCWGAFVLARGSEPTQNVQCSGSWTTALYSGQLRMTFQVRLLSSPAFCIRRTRSSLLEWQCSRVCRTDLFKELLLLFWVLSRRAQMQLKAEPGEVL